MTTSNEAKAATEGQLSTPSAVPSAPPEKPANGRAGLKHWRHDLLAGLVVSFVSLPLSSGIAIASGAPPIYGIISSIVAGLIFPFVGGSFVTISGPAAGLAPALLVTMAALGGAGDAEHVGAGYSLLLAVICMVGLFQVVCAKMGLARYAAIFPASVVEGMLGAIGILILVKALPLALGYLDPIHAHGFLEYVSEIPTWIAHADPKSAGIAAACLAVFGLVGTKRAQALRVFRTVPAHVFAVGLGILLAWAVGLGEALLISVPANPLSGLQMPAFGTLFQSSELWKPAAIGFLTLTLIDGVESLATAQAVDRIDPFRRKSEPSKVLRAMGISNVVSSLVGGLTIIPGGVKSKTCIEAGGRTLWANFANAVFLLCFLFVAPGLVSLMPKAALGAVLVFTGWKMVHPKILRHLGGVGSEQVVFYVATIVATLLTDLLIGVLAGTAVKLAYVVVRSGAGADRKGLLQRTFAPFRDPVTSASVEGSTLFLTVDRPLVCFNAYKLMERLDQRSESIDAAIVTFGSGVTMIDHTAAERVFSALDEATPQPLRLEGFERLRPKSDHPSAVRILDVEASLNQAGG